jgi:hypothetical protein
LEYCASLTEEYKVALDNPDAYVYYNGTSCVVHNPKNDTEGEAAVKEEIIVDPT